MFVTLRQVGGTTVASGKSVRIIYSKYVCVALGIQHAMRRIIICVLPRSTIFFHIIA